MTVMFGLGVCVGVGVGLGGCGRGCGCGCGFERCESGGVSGCLGFEGVLRHVGLVADVVVLLIVVVLVAGGVEERRGGLGGERARSLFSTRLLQGVRVCFCIHPFFLCVDYGGDGRWGLGRYFYVLLFFSGNSVFFFLFFQGLLTTKK